MTGSIKKHLPIGISHLSLVASVFFLIKYAANYFFVLLNQIKQEDLSFPLLGDPIHPTFLGMALTTVFMIGSWLFSTKVAFYKKTSPKAIYFLTVFMAVAFHFLWYATAPVYRTVIPYLEDLASKASIGKLSFEAVLLQNTDQLMTILILLPGIIGAFILLWMGGLVTRDQKEIMERFAEYEFVSAKLQKFVKVESQADQLPDVVLGPDSKTKEQVIIPGQDRTLNGIIVGSIGTGKTAALVLPLINQDLHWMAKFINDYPELSKREDFHTEEVKGRYLNGITVIEPSNDLCQKAYKLVQAHNIPTESVFYIDPTNKDTPCINPLEGPVERVAESLAMVVEGLGDGARDFFGQSQRNHLKYYVYLLKLYDPENEPTFDLLIDMYNDAQLVRHMHVQLKELIPADWETYTDRDERNHWHIVKGVDDWFEMNHLPQADRAGNVEKIKDGKYRGEVKYYDAEAEYVKGLRNILNDLAANKLIRRVLFGKSNFSMDAHLENGGVLLVNTAKGEMQNLSNVFGKIVLLSVQNAVFRRTPASSTYHAIYCDEFPDYVYQSFREFPAQSRKYKAIITVVTQTIAQLADHYGEYYMHTLLTTLRNKMVYADVSEFDANVFSRLFHENSRFEESTSEQSVSPMQDNPMTRMGSSYKQTREAIMSPDDILAQREFQCAVKIVKKNRSMPVKQIDANFVPKEEFKKAIIQVDDERAVYWLERRRELLQQGTVALVGETVEESTEREQALLEQFQEERKLTLQQAGLDPVIVEANTSREPAKQPRKEIRFKPISRPVEKRVETAAPSIPSSRDVLESKRDVPPVGVVNTTTQQKQHRDHDQAQTIEKARVVPKLVEEQEKEVVPPVVSPTTESHDLQGDVSTDPVIPDVLEINDDLLWEESIKTPVIENTSPVPEAVTTKNEPTSKEKQDSTSITKDQEDLLEELMTELK